MGSQQEFSYRIIFQGKYILMELSGVLDERGIKEASGTLMAISMEKNTRKALYDASLLKQSDKARRESLKQFKFVSERMDKMASYLPDLKIYAIAKFLSIAGNIKNWKPFRTKEKAIEWLEA